MKIRGETAPGELSDELAEVLEEYRAERGFNVESYVEKKVALIDKYFSSYGLKAAVVAVSGGVDSAVVLGLLARVPSIERIVPVLLPSNTTGVSNQDLATTLGREVCEHFNVSPSVVEMGGIVSTSADTIQESLSAALGSPEGDGAVVGSEWARGQLTPYMRTPFLYYHTTLLTDAGIPALLVGTTNYSEGGYLGYIGKASDGMVDLQVITDLYKSEVYTLAEYLGVPSAVTERAPTGDMYEEISDEEVFGATYDFVELFMEIKSRRYGDGLNALSAAARKEYKQYAESLESMHRYNRHKYLGASPAVHLDVIKNTLNAWTTNQW